MSEQGLAIANKSSPAQPSIDLTFPQGLPIPEAVTDTEVRKSAKLMELLHWVFSFPAMLGAFLVGLVFSGGRAFFVDPDLWWHIRNGQNILATHRWPTTDPYSFTVAGTSWLAYEWLGDVLLGFMAKSGLQALDGLLITLASLVILALYYYSTLCSENSKAGFVSSLLLCPLAFASFTLRPQMFGFLFLILTLIALELFRRGRQRALWFLPPLFVVWVNVHGSWVIGLGLVAVSLTTGLFEFHIGSVEAQHWTKEQRIQLELMLLASLAMIPVTPYGTRIAAYPFMVASSLPINVANILEWKPMPFELFGGKLFLGTLVFFFAFQIMYHFTFRVSQWILFLGGTITACMHRRFVLLFVAFFAPLLATMLARWFPRYIPSKDKFALNVILMVGVAAAMFWYFPSRPALDRIVEKEFPVRAVNYLRNHAVAGPIYNTYASGGYLIWALPEQKVFIDGRGDLYEIGGAFAEYLEAADLKPRAFFVLRAHGIRTCLLQRNEPLATALGEHPDWQQVYGDEVNVIFVRREEPLAFDLAARKQTAARKE